MRNRHAITAPVAEQVSSPLEIVYRDIDDLIPQLKNVRRHPKKQIAQIAGSIKAFGLNLPFLIDRNSRLISGHGRVTACQMLGLRRVPTICLEHLSEAQRLAFAIADNKIAEGGRWERSCLAEELRFLSGINLEFQLETTGFDVKEIELLINGVDPPRKNTNTAEELSDAHSEIPVSSPRDVWRLGSHRLICGSAWDQQSYSVLMDGHHAAAAFTYLPRGSNENAESIIKLFSHVSEYSDRAAYQFLITEDLLLNSLLVAAERAGLEVADLCIAIKEAAQPGRLYKNQGDLVFVFQNRDAEQSNKQQFERTNIWEYPRVRSRRRKSEPPQGGAIHRELAPALVADAITDSTAVGEIVLVPFLGQASTLIAAQQTGRICCAIEADLLAMDRAIRLWQQVTGLSAKHVNQDMSFDQVAEARNVTG